MKNAKIGNAYHAFKQREERIIRKLDGLKRLTRVRNYPQDLPRHHDVNSQGRTWTF